MTTAIERYLNSLSEYILILDISCRGIKSLPNLTRFKNLEKLYCSNNQLTSLPSLPQKLIKLSCDNNQLTSLPTLPPNLKILDCFNNQLTSLPTLPQNLQIFNCVNNQLASFPTLPQNLQIFNYVNNPISEIVNNTSLVQIKQNIQTLNNCRHLYYCVKLKKLFREWLWEKVREPKIMKLYHPNYLIENLGQDDDLDTVLNNWINK